MRSGPVQVIQRLAKFAIPAVIIGYLLLYYVGPEEWQQLADQPKNYGLLAAALGVATAGLILSFVRWCILVRCQGIELTMLEAIRLGAICFLLSFVSAGSVGGDLFKAVFLARRRPGKRVAAVASVLVDRATGLYALVLLVAVALVLTNPHAPDTTAPAPFVSEQIVAGSTLERAAAPESGTAGRESQEADSMASGLAQIKWVTGVLFAVGTGVLLFLVLGGKWVDQLIQVGSKFSGVGTVISHVGPPLRIFHSHRMALGASLLLSLGVHSMLAISVFLIAKALYAAPPTFAEHFVIVPIGMLISALPITPAGIGLFEAAIESMYHLIPAQPTLASGTVVALVFELVKILLAIIGTVFYWTANEEVMQSLEEAGDEETTRGQTT